MQLVLENNFSCYSHEYSGSQLVLNQYVIIVVLNKYKSLPMNI